MEESQKVLKLAVSMGEQLLENGGEIYRVQETMVRILEAYGTKDYHVFVVSNGLFATVHEDQKDRGSMVRYVPLGSMHLGKVTALNQLSREICNGDCTLDEAYERLEQCKELAGAGSAAKVLAGGMACGAFCYLFGGGMTEALIAFLLGMLLRLFIGAAAKGKVSKFITGILGSAMVTAISFGLSVLGLAILPDKVVIGAIMLLVPGVSLTTSIRELFNGDYLSGIIHLADALITAACIAVGVGGAVKIFQLVGGIGL